MGEAGERLLLDPDLVLAYAGALHSIALADREIHTAESSRLQAILAARLGGVDLEELFFTKVTPDGFAAAVRGRVPDRRVAIGQALVGDGIALALADGEVNGIEAHAILRFARALGLSLIDVTAVTRERLDEWLAELS